MSSVEILKRLVDHASDSGASDNYISKPDVAEETKAGVTATADEYIRDFVPSVKGLLFQQNSESTDVGNCDRAISELISVFDDESEYHDVELDACLRLGSAALSRLYHALSLDSDLDYRGRVVWTMSEMGPDATPYLIRIFKRYPDLRVGAVIGLRSTGGSSAVEFLAKILKERPSVPPCEGCGYAPIECYIADSLGEIGDPAAIPALADYLRDPARRVDASTRRISVINALGAIGDPAAVPILREVINSWAPGKVEIEEARAALEPVLSSESWRIINERIARGGYTEVDAIREFELYNVMRALEKIGTEEARNLIRELQNDQSEDVRMVAGNILRRMTSETDN